MATSDKLFVSHWNETSLYRVAFVFQEEGRNGESTVMSKTKSTRKELSPQQRHALLTTLKARFETNMKRHKGLEWTKLQAELEGNPVKLWSRHKMRQTAGEPT